MEELEKLKEEIERQRDLLNEAVARGESRENVYECNLALDSLIEQYLDIVGRQ